MNKKMYIVFPICALIIAVFFMIFYGIDLNRALYVSQNSNDDITFSIAWKYTRSGLKWYHEEELYAMGVTPELFKQVRKKGYHQNEFVTELTSLETITGLEFVTLVTRAEYDFSPREVYHYDAHGFTFRQATEIKRKIGSDANFYDLRKQNISPEKAFELIMQESGDPKEILQKIIDVCAKEWGLEPDEKQDFIYNDFDTKEKVQTVLEAGLHYSDIKNLKDEYVHKYGRNYTSGTLKSEDLLKHIENKSLTKETLTRWRNADFTNKEICIHLEANTSFNKAKAWKSAGFSATQMISSDERGYSLQEMIEFKEKYQALKAKEAILAEMNDILNKK